MKLHQIAKLQLFSHFQSVQNFISSLQQKQSCEKAMLEIDVLYYSSSVEC